MAGPSGQLARRRSPLLKGAAARGGTTGVGPSPRLPRRKGQATHRGRPRGGPGGRRCPGAPRPPRAKRPGSNHAFGGKRTECTAATAGTVAEVPYTADYYFWKHTGA